MVNPSSGNISFWLISHPVTRMKTVRRGRKIKRVTREPHEVLGKIGTICDFTFFIGLIKALNIAVILLLL